ncbi:trafficking protein particle complex subunit 8-like isoform X2 [Branchiostoma floridae]|uniref:Trafficking protein particle complex subunit 8-like isoform X2 n=1 Tax=Branchiostoma floridae TaxID=7739 RepID=A0A9J7MTT2_BRAFL|nr:trafficking protein particle complex subunit 8-like isoform X2 [Branchiostoma floridae]
MAKCSQTAREFIQNAFGPAVAVQCSPDAEQVCQKNNLSFVEMVRPFCKLTTEAHVRDPTNQVHVIHNLRIIMSEMDTQQPVPAMARKMLNDAVSNTQPQTVEGSRADFITVGEYNLQLNSSTPWFEAYRDTFLQVLPLSDHEYLRHLVACVCVVSSKHTDPMAEFTRLSQQQHELQHTSQAKYPKWFTPNTYKYYVLLHDVAEGDDSRAEEVFKGMKSSYGQNGCHLLKVNSRPLNSAKENSAGGPETMTGNLPDPWSQFLNKKDVEHDSPDSGQSGHSTENTDTFPDKVTESEPDQGVTVTPPPETNSVHEPPAEASSEEEKEPEAEVISHPLEQSDDEPELTKSRAETEDSYNANSTDTMNQLNEAARRKGNVPHGLYLTLSDHDRLRIFAHEFAVRGLLPHIERTIRTLNEQLASRKGLHRSFFSATKKWFGGNKQAEKGSGVQSNNGGGIYSEASAEVQLRKLGDLCFLVQMYDLAYTSYHTAKRDYTNDHAWMHAAGSLEMAALSVFMQGSPQRQYPSHYMDSAIQMYNQTCKNPQFATRTTLLSTEILKSMNLFGDAAMQFIKMTSEDSDLRSALLLEQAAHCFTSMKMPMVRKYAFHMILAGHRFSKAGQRKHALRSYSQAMQIYKGKSWTLAEDHINFTIGRQSFNLKQLENAVSAFRHLLINESKQTPTQQTAFLREYLFVFKAITAKTRTSNGGMTEDETDEEEHWLTTSVNEGTTVPGTLPQLPLPYIRTADTRVLLCQESQFPTTTGSRTRATSVSLEQPLDRPTLQKWIELEDLAVRVANNGSLPASYRPTVQCLGKCSNNAHRPVCVVGETLTVEVVFSNPLRIPLVLSDLLLIWRFVPIKYMGPGGEDKQHDMITNENIEPGKMSLAGEVLHTQVIKEFVLAAQETKPARLILVPQQTGELRILGVAYSLGGGSSQQQHVSTSGIAGLQTPPPSPQSQPPAVVTQQPMLSPSPTVTPPGTTPLTSSSNQLVPPTTGSPKPPPKKPSYISSVYVRGKQELEIQGPRLNSTKQERCSTIYGSDRRLDPIVAPSMPLLEVSFLNFPTALLCGEVQQTLVEFTNTGKCTLHRLRVASSNPEFFSFGITQPEEQRTSKYIYKTLPLDGDESGKALSAKMCNVTDVIDVPLPDGTLAPGATACLPMWVRGVNSSGVHEIDFLFYYQSLEKNPKMSHRVLHHTAVVQTSNSLCIRAVAERSRLAQVSSHQDDTNCLVINLGMENLNQINSWNPLSTIQLAPLPLIHDSNITEFTILQVSAASPVWTLTPISTQCNIDMRINGKESILMCFKAQKLKKPCAEDEVVFTNIVYNKEQIDSSVTPCSDFYFRSLYVPSPRPSPSDPNPAMEQPPDEAKVAEDQSKAELEAATKVQLSLMVIWKAFVVDDTGSHVITGQHHLTLDRLDKPASSLAEPEPVVEQPPITFTKQEEAAVDQGAGDENLSQLVKYTVNHPKESTHSFNTDRLCVVGVTLVVHNCSGCELYIQVETDPTSQNGALMLKSPVHQPTISYLNTFTWISGAALGFSLAAGETRQLTMEACFCRPGVYNLSNINIFAGRGAGKGAEVEVNLEELALQRQNAPSLMVVSNSV